MVISPVLLIVVPLGLAFALPFLGFLSDRVGKYVPAVAMLFNLVVSVLLIPIVLKNPVVVSIGGFPPPLCINLVAGTFGRWAFCSNCPGGTCSFNIRI